MTTGRRPSRVVTVGRTVIEIWPDSTRVTLPDGSQVTAAPEDSDAYRRCASDHGYGDDTHRLCVEHEVAHALVPHLLGLPESPTLRVVAQGAAADLVTGCEEHAVLAFQLFCNVTGTDLLALADRLGGATGLDQA